MSTPKREFANNLSKTMKRRGITVPGLVEKSGVKERTIDRWLAGSTAPQTGNLKKLADALDVQPDDLMPDLQDQPDALQRIEVKLNQLLIAAGLPIDSERASEQLEKVLADAAQQHSPNEPHTAKPKPGSRRK